MKEHFFHQPENQFSLVKTWSFFKIWVALISVISFVGDPSQFFFPSSGKLFFKKIFIFSQRKRILELKMVSRSRRKPVIKRILFPIDSNSDSTSQNEGLVKKIHLHYSEKLLSSATISRKSRKNGFQYQGRGYSIENGLTLI